MAGDLVPAISAGPLAARDVLDDLAALRSQLELDVERYCRALIEFSQERHCPLNPDLEGPLRSQLEQWKHRFETDSADLDLEGLPLPACVLWERVQQRLGDKRALDTCIRLHPDRRDTILTGSDQMKLFAAVLLALDFDGHNNDLVPTRAMLTWLWRRLAASRRLGRTNGRPLLWLGIEHAPGNFRSADRDSLRDLGIEPASATRIPPQAERGNRWLRLTALATVVLLMIAAMLWSLRNAPTRPDADAASGPKPRTPAVPSRGRDVPPTEAPPIKPSREERRAVPASLRRNRSGTPPGGDQDQTPRPLVQPDAAPVVLTRYVGSGHNASSRAPLVAVVDGDTGRIDISMSEAIAAALGGTVLLNAFVTDGTFDQAFEQNDPEVLTKTGLDRVASRFVLGRTAFPDPIVGTLAGVTQIEARVRLSLRIYDGGVGRWHALEATGRDGTLPLARELAVLEVTKKATSMASSESK